MEAIGFLLFSWFATISGVALGGYLVQKASGGGNLFQRPGGDAFNIHDEFDQQGGDQEAEIPDNLKQMNERFRNAYGAGDYDPGEDLFSKQQPFDFGNQAAAAAQKPEPPAWVDDGDDDISEETNPGEGK